MTLNDGKFVFETTDWQASKEFAFVNSDSTNDPFGGGLTDNVYGWITLSSQCIGQGTFNMSSPGSYVPRTVTTTAETSTSTSVTAAETETTTSLTATTTDEPSTTAGETETSTTFTPTTTSEPESSTTETETQTTTTLRCTVEAQFFWDADSNGAYDPAPGGSDVPFTGLQLDLYETDWNVDPTYGLSINSSNYFTSNMTWNDGSYFVEVDGDYRPSKEFAFYNPDTTNDPMGGTTGNVYGYVTLSSSCYGQGTFNLSSSGVSPPNEQTVTTTATATPSV